MKGVWEDNSRGRTKGQQYSRGSAGKEELREYEKTTEEGV